MEVRGFVNRHIVERDAPRMIQLHIFCDGARRPRNGSDRLISIDVRIAF